MSICKECGTVLTMDKSGICVICRGEEQTSVIARETPLNTMECEIERSERIMNNCNIARANGKYGMDLRDFIKLAEEQNYAPVTAEYMAMANEKPEPTHADIMAAIAAVREDMRWIS